MPGDRADGLVLYRPVTARRQENSRLDLESIKSAAAPHYSPELPYHNFNHALAVTREAERILGKCRSEGIPVDSDVVLAAALFHDAGFHEDHGRLGFDSKEAYAAELARRELGSRSVPENVIDRVCEAILSTHCDGVCRNNESKAVRAADLSGLAADYPVFKHNSVRLKREHELLSRCQVSWQEWRVRAFERVQLFLRQDLDLTRDYFDAHGHSVFHRRARENLQRLLTDASEEVAGVSESACL